MAKYFSRILLSLFFLLISFWAQASHFMGVDITYDCLPNGCTYRIYHSTYYDCAGAAMGGFIPLSPLNPYFAPGGVTATGVGCIAPAITGTWTLVSWQEVTPVCPTVQTGCYVQGAAINGVVGATYYIDYNLCGTGCTAVQISWSNCCRNYVITSGAGGNGIGTSVTTIQPGLQPCNSSPQFSVPPIPYVCAGQTFTFSQGAYDANGDSLVYSLGPCYTNTTNGQVTYAAGYSPTQPLGPGWSVTINPSTGDITTAPVAPLNGPVVTGVVCVFVTEWRNINGVPTQIGQVERDIEFTVIPCAGNNQPPTANNTPATPNGVSNLTGGSLNATAGGTIISSCGGSNIDFDFTISDLNTAGAASGDTVCVSWTGFGLTGLQITCPALGLTAPFCYVANAANTPLVLHVNWANVPAGQYFLVIKLKDNGCPLVGQNDYTIQFNIPCCDVYPIITTTTANCNTVNFQAISSCGVPPFIYAWQGVNFNFNPNPFGPNFNYTFPGLGTYIYSCTLTDALGNDSTVLDTIIIANNSLASAGPDQVLCPNQTTVLGTPSLPGYTYHWQSVPANMGFNSPTNLAQVNVGLNVFTTIPVCVDYILTAIDPIGCERSDTVQVCFNPIPSSLFSLTSPICEGACTQVQFVGTPPAGGVGAAAFNWNFGGGQGPASTNGPGPWTVCYPTAGTYDISLEVTTTAGCVSNITTNPIIVHPIPTSTFSVTGPVCAGDPAFITYTGNASPNANYVWNFDGGTIMSGAGQGPFAIAWTTPGVHVVTLQVDEFGCNGLQTSMPVTVNSLPTACFSLPNNVCVNTPNQVVYSCGQSTPTSVFDWTFGSGTVQMSGSGAGPYTLSWTTPGQYTVCLQVTENGCTSTAVCDTLNVLPAPIANIAPVNDQCIYGNNFSFTYTGTPVSYYSWDFGASATPASMTGTPNPTGIVYTNPGPKIVTVYTVQNGCTSDTAYTSFNVNPMPSPNFTANHASACLGDCVIFNYTGTPISNQQAFAWDFGPNANVQFSTLQNPGCVQFNFPGTQTITLVVDHLGCKDTMTQQVFIHPGPTVTAGVDKTFCDGGSATLDATVSGGFQPYGYSWWSNPANGGLSNQFVEDPTVTSTATTTYYFQTTDGYGCRSNIDSAKVNVLAKPIVNAGPDHIICDAAGAPGVFLNGSLAASNLAPAPFTYSWFCNTSPNCGMNLGQELLEDPFVRPTVTTIYTFVVTSANGCSSYSTTLDTASTTTVFVNPVPNVNAGPDKAICLGDQVQLYGSASNAGPFYHFQWTPNDPTAGLVNDTLQTTWASPDHTITYTLTALSNGCSGSDQVVITVNTLPTASIEPPLWDICQGASVQLTGTADGDPNGNIYTYSWVPATGLSNANIANPIASPQTTTTYQLIAGTATCKGFVDNITITVKPTPITTIAQPDSMLCHGDSMKLVMNYAFVGTAAGTPILYQWTPTTGLSNPTSATTWAKPDQTTIYTATISVAGDCPTTDKVTVQITPPINADATADKTTICGNESTILHATGGLGGATYTWTSNPVGMISNQSDPTVGPKQTTIYTLTVNEGACTDMDAVTVTVIPQPTADVIHTNMSGCVPLTVYMQENATNEILYIWNFGDGSPAENQPTATHTYTNPGTYPLNFTVVGNGGCTTENQVGMVHVSDTSFAVFNSNPPKDSALMVPNANVSFNDVSANPVAWVWNFGDNTTSTEQDPRHTFVLPGEYQVSLAVTNEAGCVSHATAIYHVIEPNLFMPNTFTPNGDGAFDTWVVNYEGSEKFQLQAFDRWGRVVFETTTPAKKWDGNDKTGKAVADGTYYYTLTVGKKVYNGYITVLR